MAIPTCSICLHADLAAIEEILSAGGALVPTAARFGVSKSALGRHRQFCLTPKVAAAAKVMRSAKDVHAPVIRAREIAAGAAPTPQEVLTLTGLLDRLVRSLDRLEGSATVAHGDGLHASHAALAGQITRAVEAAARMQNIGYKDTPQAQQDKFSVQIILSQPDAKQGGNSPVTIDCTREEHEALVPQVTARRSPAYHFDTDQGDDD